MEIKSKTLSSTWHHLFVQVTSFGDERRVQ